jgi:hypothetical protein
VQQPEAHNSFNLVEIKQCQISISGGGSTRDCSATAPCYPWHDPVSPCAAVNGAHRRALCYPTAHHRYIIYIVGQMRKHIHMVSPFII